MKKLKLLALALMSVSALVLSGCAFDVHSAPYPASSVVVVDPGVVAVDYWFDGNVYYYYDAGLGVYFYYDGFGIVQYCGRGWFPNAGWHRHDGGWSHDGGWNRGHGGGDRFPGRPGGDGHRPDGHGPDGRGPGGGGRGAGGGGRGSGGHR